MEQFLQVGAITSTHGIRGEVKVFPTTDDPARFKKAEKSDFGYRKTSDRYGDSIGSFF